MKNHHRFKPLLWLLLLVLLSACSVKKTKERPNIILIMADDMGYSDIGCFGGEIETPNLDNLAKGGIKFTQFYNGARCCPTRASLITGLYPHQTGIGHMTNYSENPNAHDLGIPEYRGFLNKNCVTIAEVLKKAGYTTLMTGKWHLGFEQKDQWPLQRGFDKFYGLLEGASNFFKPVQPRGVYIGNQAIDIEDENFYTTDAFTENAIKFIGESQQENENPFFLYLAYTAPHWPLQAPQEDIDKYKGRYMDGWQNLREQRYEKMKELGIIHEECVLSPQDSRSWDSLDSAKMIESDLRRSIYSAMVDRMDQNIGKLMTYLKENNLYDNTLILFLSDNGACAEFNDLGSGPASQLETKTGYVLSYGKFWANASNTPFREYKHWVHEGGISTPLIVHWPNGLSAKNKGTVIHEYGFLPDIMATFCEAANTTYPETYNGNTIPATAGKSMLPLITGKSKTVHQGQPIYWEHEGNKAVRMGSYKLVLKHSNKDEKWELYDLEQDRSELINLELKEPEKAEEMKKLWEEWASDVKVKPWNEIQEIMKEKRQKTN